MRPIVEPVRLTQQQRAAWERDGFILVKQALQGDEIDFYRDRVEMLCDAEKKAAELGPHDFLQVRNAIEHQYDLLDLLDWPRTFPLLAELLGPEIQLNTSHAMVRPPQPQDTKLTFKAIGWHRDGHQHIPAVHGTCPLLYAKIGYFLTDLSLPGRGNLRVIPGSHLNAELPLVPPGAIDPRGALEICCEPGDAVIFQQRLWHAVGPNFSDTSRVNIYMGYCYRWLKPIDYLEPAHELLEMATPLQRQLLGEYTSPCTFWLPQPGEIPLREWLQAHTTKKVEHVQTAELYR